MFRKLRAKFDGRTECPIEIQEICEALEEMGYQDEIRVVPEQMDTKQLRGTYYQFTEPSGGMYSEPRLVSLIVYPSNVDVISKRVICAKELVHVCDLKVAKTSKPHEIMELAKVLVGEGSLDDAPQMTLQVAADIVAQQKGLMLLFPKAARVIARQQIAEGTIELQTLSKRLQLPEATVEDMLEETWDALADQLSDI